MVVILFNFEIFIITQEMSKKMSLFGTKSSYGWIIKKNLEN